MILHTEITGIGEPLIFLHTGLQTGSTEMGAQKEYFNKDYNVILPDLRGHGKSVSSNYDKNNYFHKSVLDLLETMENLNIDSANIAGCSIGGLVALHFAKHHPKRVKSVTLSGIIPEKPENWEEVNIKENHNISSLLSNDEATTYFDRIHKGNWRKLLEINENNDWYPFKETNDLSMLNMPVLFIVGENAKMETIGAVQYPKTNQNIHVSILPYAGHTVHLDQPELYNIILKQFLTQSFN